MPLFVNCTTRPTGKKLYDNGKPIAFGVGDLAYNIYTFKKSQDTVGDATSYQYFCHPLYNTGSAGGGNQTIDITSTTESNRQATVFNNITTSYQHQITKSNATLTFTKETNVQVSGSPDTNVSFDPKAGSGSVTVLTKKLGTSGTNGHTVTYTTAQLSIAQENVVTTAGTKGSGKTLSVQTGTDEAKFVTYIEPSSNKNGHEISYVIDTIKVSKETNVTVSGTAGTATKFDPKAGSGSVTVLTTSLVPSETNGHNIQYTTSVLNIEQETPVSITGTAGAGGQLNPITGTGSATFVTKITPSTNKNGHTITYTTANVTIGKESEITHGTDTTSTASPTHGGTFTVIDGISFSDTNNHKYKVNVKTVTLPTETQISHGTDTTSTGTYAHGGSFTVIDNISFSDHTYKVNTKTVTLPSATPHLSSKNYIGATNAASDGVQTNPYLKHYENTTQTSQHQISGSGGTSVSSDQSGNITISSTVVNNGSLKIQQNGTDKGTFTANQSGDTTVNIAETSISKGTNSTSTSAPGSGGTFTVIDNIGFSSTLNHTYTYNLKTVTMPTPNNGKFSVQINGTEYANFTANQAGDSALNFTDGTLISPEYGSNQFKFNHKDAAKFQKNWDLGFGGKDITGSGNKQNVITYISTDSCGHINSIQSASVYSTDTHVANHTFSTTTNVANEAVNVSLSGTDPSGGGSATFIVGTDDTTVINIIQRNNGVIIDHAERFSANGTAKGDNSKTLSFGGTFTIPTISYSASGHITGWSTTTMTMPANPNTDTNYSAGTGLSLSGTTFNHADSITAGTKGGTGKYISSITYNGTGHITSISESDLPSSYTHNNNFTGGDGALIRGISVKDGHVTSITRTTGGQTRNINDIVICTESTLPPSSSRDNNILYLVI